MKEKSPIISVIKKTMPAVVSIVILKTVQALEEDLAKEKASLPAETLPLDLHNFQIPKDAIDAHGMVKIGGGSGFLVDKSGIILTNKHVIADSKAEYLVFLTDGSRYGAEVLARDPINDVAILRIKPANSLPVLSLGDSAKIELGQTVIAIGNALGIFRNTVSRGIISGLSRAISAQAEPDSPMQEMRGLIQTDAAINPGNSGGPLVNIFGEVIGINAAIVFGAQNIGFTIPVNAAKRDLADLKKFGHIKRPLLGLRYVTIDEDMKDKMKLPVDYGALVVKESHFDESVITDSPAHRAGIRDKDIILEVDGQKINTENTIQDYLEGRKVGDEITLKVLRNNSHFDAKVMLAERK
jgi:serine protease Do